MALATENNDQKLLNDQPQSHKDLVSYVMAYVDDWADYRNVNYRKDWQYYYRMWRGIWKSEDKERDSERSKLISPALQQAIEVQVSEMEEATFNKKNWFDISDDIQDQDKSEMENLRDQLLQDMELARVPASITEVYLTGALYGTGIGKLVVEDVLKQEIDPETAEPTTETRAVVSLVPITAEEFVIDPTALTIDDALGCAHDTIKPRHEIEAKKQAGDYLDKELGAYDDILPFGVSAKGENKDKDVGDKTRITEWHGLVPRDLLEAVTLQLEEDEVLEELDISPKNKNDFYEDEMVESVITIANGGALLKAVENPFFFSDRSIVAYQHDKVPNRFWGRGVAEKGASTQRALDAELRARMDGLAMTIHPMMAVDGTRLPRGASPKVAPGKTVITNGNPKDIIMPFNFGNINAETFTQGGELERMMQMATGSMDSATSSSAQPRNATASGMSMLASGAIKRTKRTMQNVDRDFLTPLVRKMAWRYMQFDNDRYPIDDYLFLPRSSMGMMAREFEQSQLTNLLSMTQQGSPTFGLLLSQIIDNSSGENKEEFKKALEQQMTPPPPDPLEQKAKELTVLKLQMEIEEIKSRASQNSANAQTRPMDAQTSRFDAQTKRLKVQGEIQDNELDRQSSERTSGRSASGEK